MAEFIPTGMRTKIEPRDDVLVVNTCSDNDTRFIGDTTRWSWSNPTNRRFGVVLPAGTGHIQAISTEAAWQGTKVLPGTPGVVEQNGEFYLAAHDFLRANEAALAGNWRTHKGKKPIGAWIGPNQPLIRSPGEARRRIYFPAYFEQLTSMMRVTEVAETVNMVRRNYIVVYLRDFDTGYSVNAPKAMSHAFLLAAFLNGRAWESLK